MDLAEVLAREPVGEEAEEQPVLHDRVLVEVAATLDAGVALGDALGVAAQAEGVHVEAVAEEAERARAHAEIFVMVDDVLVEALVVRLAERPGRELAIAAAERVEDAAVLVGELDARRGDRRAHARARLRGHHEGVGRRLAGVELRDLVHVVVQDVEGLAPEAEHHVDVDDREELLRVLQALEDLFA